MKSISSQIRLWWVLGPAMLLIPLLMLLVKISVPFLLLPVTAFFGFFLCWHKKLGGVLLSLILLCAVLFFYYPQMSAHERLWQMGMAMSFALGCLITALCSEEVEAILHSMKRESDSRLEHLKFLDEKLKKNQELAKSRQTDLIKAHLLLSEKERKICSQAETISILREELKATCAHSIALTQRSNCVEPIESSMKQEQLLEIVN